MIRQSYHPKDVNPKHVSCRLRRALLQNALLKEVDQPRIQLSKRLVSLEKLPSGKVEIKFGDGFTDQVDLVVGADGIRSVSSPSAFPMRSSANGEQFVRSYAFPDHKIQYNGQSAYRTIIHRPTAEAIEGIPQASTFWQNLHGKYVFTSPLGGTDFEVTARISRPSEGQEHVSWGRPFDFSTLVSEYDEFAEPVRKVVALAAATGGTQEFALFSGPRLDRVVAADAVALLGDASHPLSGAFGAGVGFALEDVYALTKALEWAWKGGRGVAAALDVYDKIRSPHYRNLYDVLDWYASIGAEIKAERLSVDDEIQQRVERTTGRRGSWMYDYEVETVVDEVLREADKTLAV